MKPFCKQCAKFQGHIDGLEFVRELEKEHSVALVRRINLLEAVLDEVGLSHVIEKKKHLADNNNKISGRCKVIPISFTC